MADENILTRLGKLFQNSIVLRKTDDGKIKVKDVDFTQSFNEKYVHYVETFHLDDTVKEVSGLVD